MAGSSNIGLLLAALVIFLIESQAQPRPTRASCEGRRITSISVTPKRPPFAGSARRWQAVARAFGLHHATTRTEVIRAYFLMKEGDLCSDSLVAESERVIRDLPFLADAIARSEQDDSGGVAIDIETTDEVPVLVAGSLRHGVPAALSLGNENVGGLGLRLVAGGERGGAYRGAAHFEAVDYAPFDKPISVRFQTARDPLGSHVEVDASHLFLSNVERGAWQASYRMGDDFPLILRPTGDAETVEVHTERWSIGGVIRSVVGPAVVLWGPVALGSRSSPADHALIVSDSGAIGANDSALVNRFDAFHSVRLGGLIGARRVRYVSRVGLDALFAPQDVMLGWQLGVVAAPGTTSGGHDLLVAHSLYLGAATNRSVVVGDVEAEARRDFSARSWESTVVNARMSAYFIAGSRVLLDVQDNFSSLFEARLPTQLALGDPLGGPRGFLGSTIAGGRRNVARFELRGAQPQAVHGADAGFAVFADAATMWAGDVPYGTSASRQSVGVSVLASYPTRSKRLYRIDFAFPIQRDHGRGVEIRFTNGDPTSSVSVEPSDVNQARLIPIPSSLFAWPGR